MANFRGMEVTQKGRAVLAKLLVTDEPTTLTRVALGDGILPDGQALDQVDALINPHTSLPITTKEIIGNEVVQIETKFRSQNFPNSVKFHEIGVFALDPETGEEVLYAYDNAAEGDTIPANGGGTFVIRTFRVLVQVANATKVDFGSDSGGGSGSGGGTITSYSLRRKREAFTSTAGQTEFKLATLSSTGAIDVFIEGAWTMDWTTPEGANKIILNDALPAGREVVFVETLLTEAGA